MVDAERLPRQMRQRACPGSLWQNGHNPTRQTRKCDPMLISFAWTTGVLLAGRKTVTRRAGWKASTMKRWQDAYDRHQLVHDAYDKLPRSGGKKVGDHPPDPATLLGTFVADAGGRLGSRGRPVGQSG